MGGGLQGLNAEMLSESADIKLDAGFKEFYRYCESADIPVVIISR